MAHAAAQHEQQQLAEEQHRQIAAGIARLEASQAPPAAAPAPTPVAMESAPPAPFTDLGTGNAGACAAPTAVSSAGGAENAPPPSSSSASYRPPALLTARPWPSSATRPAQAPGPCLGRGRAAPAPHLSHA